jgi:hypothetical protein
MTAAPASILCFQRPYSAVMRAVSAIGSAVNASAHVLLLTKTKPKRKHILDYDGDPQMHAQPHDKSAKRILPFSPRGGLGGSAYMFGRLSSQDFSWHHHRSKKAANHLLPHKGHYFCWSSQNRSMHSVSNDVKFRTMSHIECAKATLAAAFVVHE